MPIQNSILSILGFCVLAGCEAPPPQTVIIHTTEPAPVRKPVYKPRTTVSSSSTSTNTRVRQVDGRTVIDTPPEEVEPVRTVPLEVDR